MPCGLDTSVAGEVQALAVRPWNVDRHSPVHARIKRLASLDEARACWTKLAERSDNIFSTWEWADVWWRHFGHGRTLELATVAADSDPVALLPLCTARRFGLNLRRFVGHGVADQLGPVCDPGDAPVAIAGLEAAVESGGVLLAERLLADRDWQHDLGGRAIRNELSPLIDLVSEGNWDSYLAARSANFRQQVRRRQRRLEREGLRFRLADDPARLNDDVSALFTLHSARWGESASPVFRRGLAFHLEFAACALRRGWLRLWLAEADGVPVAAWYGFRFAGVEYYYQSGRDPAWDRQAIGAGILEHSIREAFADGMREYRLLRGDEAYKRRYATSEPGLATVAAARDPLGRAAVATLDVLAGSPAGRRIVKRLG
jgi:CelD/BcsL family acetyltransferase involved in cellulose biosynthesis